MDQTYTAVMGESNGEKRNSLNRRINTYTQPETGFNALEGTILILG